MIFKRALIRGVDSSRVLRYNAGVHYDSVIQLKNATAEGETQGDVFVQLTQKLTRATKAGAPYLELTLADAADSMIIKVWDNAPWNAACRAMPEGAFVAVTADWTCNQYGMEAKNVDYRPLTPDEEEVLLSGGAEMRAAQEQAWQDILDFIAGMQDPRLAALCRALTEAHEARFRRAAAARGMHHARRGGLVEHTAGVMRAADAICGAYPHINRDLVLAGALFHDCGKMWETGCAEQGFAVEYSDMGELLGHISVSIEVVNKLWQGICTAEQRAEWKGLTPATEQVRLHLLHLIASHHGVLEYGSPVVPKTPEAFVLHHADNIDAKLEMFRSAYETSEALTPTIRRRKFGLEGNAVSPLPAFKEGSEA